MISNCRLAILGRNHLGTRITADPTQSWPAFGAVKSCQSVAIYTTLCHNIRFMKDESGTLSGRLEPWASVEEVTAHLGVGRDTIYRWIDAKRMPAHRIGRLWKFKLSEVDSWVRSGGADEIVQQKADPPQGADQ